MRRTIGLLLAFAVAVGGLAVGVAPAVADIPQPSIDGPQTVWVTGTSMTVSGTDPNGVGGQVSLALDETSAVATATVQPDTTWSADVDLTGVPDGLHHVVVTVSTTTMVVTVYVYNDPTSLTITSPSSGATITSTDAGCVTVTASLNVDASLDGSYAAYLSSSGGTGYAAAGGDQTGKVWSSCVPVHDVPDGPAFVELFLGGTTRDYVARIPVTLDLTAKANVTAVVGSAGVVVTGTVTDSGPDTQLTGRIDGGAPRVIAVAQPGYVPLPTTPWKFTNYWEAWSLNADGLPYYDRALADGPHTVTLSLTSRGATTEYGPYELVVDGTPRITMDAPDLSRFGYVDLTGTFDNIDGMTYGDSNLTLEVYRNGTLDQYTGNKPTFTSTFPSVYGTDRWTYKDIYLGLDLGPVVIKVKARARNQDTVCVATTISGGTATPTPCGPVAPGIPTNPRVTSSSNTTATIAFDPPASTGGAPIAGYTLKYYKPFQYTQSSIDSVGTTPSITLTGLPAEATGTTVSLSTRTSVGSSPDSPRFYLYGSRIECTTKPPATAVIGTSVPVKCWYDNGLRGVRQVPDPVTVSLQVRAPGATTWTTAGSATVALVTELATFSVPVKKTGTYSVRVVAAGFDFPNYYYGGYVRASSSPTMTTSVTLAPPKLSLKLSSTKVKYGAGVTFSGSSSPSFVGQKVYLQRYVSGAWKTVTSQSLSTSSYRFAFKPTSRADYRYRVWTPAAKGRPSAASPAILLTVV